MKTRQQKVQCYLGDGVGIIMAGSKSQSSLTRRLPMSRLQCVARAVIAGVLLALICVLSSGPNQVVANSKTKCVLADCLDTPNYPNHQMCPKVLTGPPPLMDTCVFDNSPYSIIYCGPSITNDCSLRDPLEDDWCVGQCSLTPERSCDGHHYRKCNLP